MCGTLCCGFDLALAVNSIYVGSVRVLQVYSLALLNGKPVKPPLVDGKKCVLVYLLEK